MADSLMDFGGNLAQLAQGNLRNAMQLHQMGIQEQQLGLQQRRADIDEQQLAVNQQSATLNQIKTLHEVYKDPRYQFNPDVRNHLMTTVLKLAGAPADGINAITSRNEEMDGLMKGLASTDPAKIQDAYRGLSITMTPEQFAEFRKKTEDADKLHQQNEAMAQLRKMNEAQFQRIQDNTARVNMGRPLAVEASVAFDRLLQGTDTPRFSEVLKAAQGKPDVAAALMSSASKFSQDVKRKIPQILDGKLASKTKEFSDLAERHKEDASIAEDTLKQWKENKVQLPKNVSPAMLEAKIEMSTIAADAYRAMSEWTMTPFDEGKYRAARNGAKNIEAFRQELDVLDKKTQRESAQLKNAAMALANEKFDMSHQEKLASDYAQRVFKEKLASGMDENRAAVAAGNAATEQFPDTSYDADKLKTSKPLATASVQIQQNSPGERKDIAEGRSQLDMVDRITTLFSPDFVGPLDSRLGRVKSFSGEIKDQEAEFRSAVQLMRTELRKFYFGTAQSQSELKGALDAIPDLDMSDTQFMAAMAQTKKNINSALNRRMEVMEQSNVKSPRETKPPENKSQPQPSKPAPASGKKLDMRGRYGELEKSGLSKQEIFKKLNEEGY